MKNWMMRPSAAGALVFQLSVLLGIALPGLMVAVRGTAAEPGSAETKYTVDKGVLYLPHDDRQADDYADEMCRLDLYRPEGVKGFPTIVFYHGGGLTGGQRCVPRELTNRGWAVVGAGYRLHPQVQHPVYIEDAAAALAWTFIDKYAPLYHVRQDAPPILCVTGGWEVDMLMRAEENLYFVSMLKLVGHKAVKHIVIESALITANAARPAGRTSSPLSNTGWPKCEAPTRLEQP